MFVVFDLDGTLALIEHRRHHLDRKDWRAFFAACEDDLPNLPVIDTLWSHLKAGHRVEIWSGRSDEVRTQTVAWLDRHGLFPSLLTHMRAAGDYTPDVDLKRSWLHALHPDDRPDAVYDDRGRVVEMWRGEGVPCFQVAPDWEQPRIVPPTTDPLLTIMVGPSGAGKTEWVRAMVPAEERLSSDDLREVYTGSVTDQSRNDDVFASLHRLARARLESGLPVTIDATNLRRKDRLACVALAPPGAGVRYVVCNRPMDEKIRDAGWRRDVLVKGVPLLEAHEQRFQSQIGDILAGDGLPQVTVLDLRSERRAAA